MATNYVDGGLIRGSLVVNIACVNYILKSLKFDNLVRIAYEYDQNGLPYASSSIVDFQKFNGEIMAYLNVNAPPQMVEFNANLGSGATNYQLLDRTFNYTTEGLQSYSVTGVQLIH